MRPKFVSIYNHILICMLKNLVNICIICAHIYMSMQCLESLVLYLILKVYLLVQVILSHSISFLDLLLGRLVYKSLYKTHTK